jgi:hypothetical protein
MPPAVQCIKKFDDHLKHVFDSVAFKHGVGDKMEVCEITTIVGGQL